MKTIDVIKIVGIVSLLGAGTYLGVKVLKKVMQKKNEEQPNINY